MRLLIEQDPGGMVQFWYFFFPRRGGELFSLETTSPDHGDIPTGFVRVLVFCISHKTKVFSGNFILFHFDL